MGRNSGKALALDTKIPTPSGFSTMGNLNIGDYVFDEQGKPTKITYVSDIFLGNRCFEFVFEDGEVITCDANHLWSVVSENVNINMDSLSMYIFFIENNVKFKIPTSPLSDFKIQNKEIISIKEVPSVPTKCISVDSLNSLYLCGEKFTVTHNTTLGSPFIMAKSLLIPNFQAYIMAGSGNQSQEMFMKIEKIAKREIASFTGLTDIFFNETVKSAANTDGFTHNPASFQYKLYNGSQVNSLNGNVDGARGKRSNLNFYDESGFVDTEFFHATEPFVTQNSDFRLGGDVDVSLFPKQFSNQIIYASSASSIDTYFFSRYKEFSKKMFLGDKRYFAADINSDVVISATYNGKLYPVPLLSQEVIDSKMRENKEKAMREYKNIFTTEGGNDQIIKRAAIIRNSKLRKPVLANSGGQKFILAVDPARSYDNSICGVGELIYDEIVGHRVEICNIVNFVDVAKKKKTPMKTPNQIKHFKDLLLGYNGIKSAEYEYIDQVLIDSGAGGAGVSAWADGLLDDWTDENGIIHKGLIDSDHEEYKDNLHDYPNAKEILTLINPNKFKREIFEALIEMMSLDLISFSESYDGKGYITYIDDEGKTKQIKLSKDEEESLVNIDVAKEELVSIYAFKSTNGNVRYDLPPDKQNKIGDDRAYTIAMIAWRLKMLRREDSVGRKREEIDLTKIPTQVSTLNITL